MVTTAIRAEGLWKQYAVGLIERPMSTTFYDVMSEWLRAPLERIRTLGGTVGAAESFWALRDVSFEVNDGEAVGIIGRNGAGKSTLLKILSRITAPSRGRVTMQGRLASLLEVGTGFHPELSGRENIFLNGAIMGMSRREVADKFDEIVSFAGVEKFIDTPVKRYSSGMYVRLAFAVAAHLEADILVVDEVLAVGDAAFQRKSLSKMGDVARRGRTVLFVSHNLGAIRNLCTRALVLEEGSLKFDGEVGEGIVLYERSFASAGAALSTAQFRGPLVGQLRFESLICHQAGVAVELIDPMMEFEIEILGVAMQSFPTLEIKLGFFSEGFQLGSCHDTTATTGVREGSFVSRFHFPSDFFRPGRYSLGLGASAQTGMWVWGSDVAVLDFSENRGGRSAERADGVIAIPYRGERIQ